MWVGDGTVNLQKSIDISYFPPCKKSLSQHVNVQIIKLGSGNLHYG